jgi:hypothetical protein
MKQAVVAGGWGVLASGILAGLEAWSANSSLAGRPLVLLVLQIPGYFVAVLVWGPHSGGDAFEAVMIVVNAIVFSFVILGAMKVKAHLRRAK